MQVCKVCMIGDYAVGKTSLVGRFVRSTFSEKYLTTVGVKVDTHEVLLDSGEQLKLVLWDIESTKALKTVEKAYLRGAAAYLLVIDGTRRSTLETARSLQGQAQEFLGPVPFIVLVNKSDLQAEWEVTDEDLAALSAEGWNVLHTSAKTGEAVVEAFQRLAADIVAAP